MTFVFGLMGEAGELRPEEPAASLGLQRPVTFRDSRSSTSPHRLSDAASTWEARYRIFRSGRFFLLFDASCLVLHVSMDVRLVYAAGTRLLRLSVDAVLVQARREHVVDEGSGGSSVVASACVRLPAESAMAATAVEREATFRSRGVEKRKAIGVRSLGVGQSQAKPGRWAVERWHDDLFLLCTRCSSADKKVTSAPVAEIFNGRFIWRANVTT